MLAQRLVAHGDTGCNRIEGELNVLKRDSLGSHEARLVCLEPPFHVRARRTLDGLERRGRNHHEIPVALLALELGTPPELGRSDEGGGDDAALQLADLQILAQIRLEGGLGPTLLPQQRCIPVARELPVDLKSRNRVKRVYQLLIADPVAKVARALAQQFATHEVVEQRALLALYQLGGELVANLALQLRLTLLPGPAHLVERHAFAVDARRGRRGGALEVDAPEHKHQRDRCEKRRCEPTGDPVAYLLMQGLRVRAPPARIDATQEKARTSGPFRIGKWRSGRVSNPRPPA